MTRRQHTMQDAKALMGGLIAGLVGGAVLMRQRHVRVTAEEGIRQELRKNDEGVEGMRAAIPTEIENISGTVSLLEQREAGRAVDGSKVKIGLAVLALPNVNWQTASVTGAVETLDSAMVERFAGAYCEQARSAQLQSFTTETMMFLSSYVGEKI